MYEVGNENYEIANKYINLPFLDYVPLICNASEIHVSDSSFFCLAIQLVNTEIQKCVVYPRSGISFNSKYHYIDKGWHYVFLKELHKQQKKTINEKVFQTIVYIYLDFFLFVIF